MAEGRALRLRPEAFDSFAPTYDADFARSTPGQWLRAAVWRHLTPHLRPGMRVLDLGCGTGEDAIWLAGEGCRVVAADSAPAMLELTKQKALASGCADRISTLPLDINDPPRLVDRFDLVLSNFGALNCADDLRAVGTLLGRTVEPGGVVALNVMGRFCAWETLWHGLHGRRAAFRRWGGRAGAAIGASLIPIRYWSAQDIQNALGPEFRLLSVHGIGVFLPPSELYAMFDRWPRLFRLLAHWEARFASNARLAGLADHQLVILRRPLVHQ